VHDLSFYDQLSRLLFDIISNFHFWLTLILSVYISILPVLINRRFELLFNDNIITNLMQRRYKNNYAKKTYIKKIEEMNKYKRSLAKFKKIFRLHEDYEPDNLADKKIKDVVDNFKRSRQRTLTTKGLDGVGKLVQERVLNNAPVNINIYNNNIINGQRYSGGTSEYEIEDPHKKKLMNLVNKLNIRSQKDNGSEIRFKKKNTGIYDENNNNDIGVLNSENRELNQSTNRSVYVNYGGNEAPIAPASRATPNNPKTMNYSNFNYEGYD
jgi:hypothetical protein